MNALKQVPVPASEEGRGEGRRGPPPAPLPSETEVLRAPQGSKELSAAGPPLEISPELPVAEDPPVGTEAGSAVQEQGCPQALGNAPLAPPQPSAAAPPLPALSRLQVAPSMASLASLASSTLDVTCSNLDLYA